MATLMRPNLVVGAAAIAPGNCVGVDPATGFLEPLIAPSLSAAGAAIDVGIAESSAATGQEVAVRTLSDDGLAYSTYAEVGGGGIVFGEPVFANTGAANGNLGVIGLTEAVATGVLVGGTDYVCLGTSRTATVTAGGAVEVAVNPFLYRF